MVFTENISCRYCEHFLVREELENVLMWIQDHKHW
jgi:hypothetical protein